MTPSEIIRRLRKVQEYFESTDMVRSPAIDALIRDLEAEAGDGGKRHTVPSAYCSPVVEQVGKMLKSESCPRCEAGDGGKDVEVLQQKYFKRGFEAGQKECPRCATITERVEALRKVNDKIPEFNVQVPMNATVREKHIAWLKIAVAAVLAALGGEGE